jgi:hypothetical protein
MKERILAEKLHVFFAGAATSSCVITKQQKVTLYPTPWGIYVYPVRGVYI